MCDLSPFTLFLRVCGTCACDNKPPLKSPVFCIIKKCLLFNFVIVFCKSAIQNELWDNIKRIVMDKISRKKSQGKG